MASFALVHNETGCSISGYVLREASESEVNEANLRMGMVHSQWRYEKLPAQSPAACLNPAQQSEKLIH
jgi:hypothetical protein